MSWTGRASSTTTPHTCGGPVFGKKTPGCPRCDELLAGATPVVWAGADRKRRQDEQDARARVAHFASAAHRAETVCTYGDW
jgi:hypothetical protein